MDVEKEMKFWSKELKIPPSRFINPYIKESKKANIDHKGFGHGTFRLLVYDTRLKERILMGIKAIADCYGKMI